MEEQVKIKISELRNKGLGYKKIASELEVNINSVKSFCRSNNLTSEFIKGKQRCKQCKKELYQPLKMKTIKFCCKNCRVEWWNKHRHLIQPKTKIEIKCCGCGKIFYAYAAENRKFCSHSCYVDTRFKGGRNNG